MKPNELVIMTECPEHGVESITAPAVALGTPTGCVFAFSFDEETGGLLVSVPEGSLSVGIFSKDGMAVESALVLLASDAPAAPHTGPLN